MSGRSFVLVPGAGGSAWYWHRVVPLLPEDLRLLPQEDAEQHAGGWGGAAAERTRAIIEHLERQAASLPPAERLNKQVEIAAMLASKGDSKLPIPLRRIKVKRDKGGTITLITNDLERTAVEIAALYKGRWQIELLFRLVKQHLHIRKFFGQNENAIRLQILAAMIAYLLLRIAARLQRLAMPALPLTELVFQRLFLRRPLAEIDKPPPVNPSRRQLNRSHNQLEFCYA